MKSPFIGQNNCPILERTADGHRVGRCWYHCPDNVCPRHGDVKAPLERYRKTGELTDEQWLSRDDASVIHNPD
jgi:hypothetical protein